MPVKTNKIIVVLRSVALAIVITGGLLSILASGSSGDGSSSSSSPTPTSAINYEGSTNPAVIAPTNAALLLRNVIATNDTANTVSPLSTTDATTTKTNNISSQSALAHRLHSYALDAFKQAQNKTSPTRVRPFDIPIDETDTCDSGSLHTSGILDDDGVGTLDVNYDHCQVGDETLNGRGMLRIDAFDLALFSPLDSTFSFAVLTLTSPSEDVSVSGSLRSQLNLTTNTTTLTTNMVTRDNTSGRMIKAENLVVTDQFDDLLSFLSELETITGRIYDSVHGFVDVDTSAPLAFIDSPFFLLPTSGRLVLFGATNSSVRVTVLSGDFFIFELLRFEFDLDGDGTYDNGANLRWIELAAAIGADLGDNDGDGMHNSWESFFGLNPSDPSDAAADADGDGFASNLTEYLGYSDPNDRFSLPRTQFRTLILTTSDIIYSPLTGRIYASIPGDAPAMANRLAIIDPATGLVEGTVAVGSDPGPLAISGDGQFLYVGLNGTEGSIRRVDLTSGTLGPEFLLGSDPSFGSYFAEDIEVLSGSTSTLAVSRRYKGANPRHAGVAIYDNGVQRANATSGNTAGSNVIEFGGSTTVLYGYDNETTEAGFRTMAIDANGVTVTNVATGLLSGIGVDIRFDNGRIYADSGAVIDAAGRTLIKTLEPAKTAATVVPDSSADRAYLITSNAGTELRVESFAVISASPNPRLFTDIPRAAGNASGLIRWGRKGLAFRTDQNQLVIIDDPIGSFLVVASDL